MYTIWYNAAIQTWLIYLFIFENKSANLSPWLTAMTKCVSSIHGRNHIQSYGVKADYEAVTFCAGCWWMLSTNALLSYTDKNSKVWNSVNKFSCKQMVQFPPWIRPSGGPKSLEVCNILLLFSWHSMSWKFGLYFDKEFGGWSKHLVNATIQIWILNDELQLLIRSLKPIFVHKITYFDPTIHGNVTLNCSRWLI